MDSESAIAGAPGQGTATAGGGRRWPLYTRGVLALFLLMAYLFVFAMQPGYGPDEPRHYRYVKLLVEKHRLPLMVNGVELEGAHTTHPPLYYALMSPVYVATRSMGMNATIRVVKCLSPLLLFGALLLYVSLLRRIFPDRPFTQAAALTVAALLPEFLLEASVMNNDSLAILLGALWVWLLVRTWDEPPSWKTALAAGLVMAAFVNTKAQGWTLAPLWLLAIALRAHRVPARRGGLLRDLAVGYLVLAMLGPWWYVRNMRVYGQPVPLDFMGGTLQPRDARTGAVLSPAEVYTSGEVLPLGWRAAQGIFLSFWSQIDWLRDGAAFGQHDLKHPGSFIVRLRSGQDQVMAGLWERMTPGAKAALAAYDPSTPPSASLVATLVAELNRQLPARGLSAVLIAQTGGDRDQTPARGEDASDLNRRLLEQAYPDEIVATGVASPAPRVIFGLFVLLVLLAVAGGVIRVAQAPAAGRAHTLGLTSAAVIPAAGFALNWLHTWYVATFIHLGFYQGGRYVMPSVFGAGTLLAAGWTGLLGRRAGLAACLVLLALLLALDFYCLVRLLTVLNPRYVG